MCRELSPSRREAQTFCFVSLLQSIIKLLINETLIESVNEVAKVTIGSRAKENVLIARQLVIIRILSIATSLIVQKQVNQR